MFRFILAFLFLPGVIVGQTPVGTWSDHLCYSASVNVVAGKEEVYSSTGSSILVYNKSLSELRKLSTINGLSETGISAIGWSEENKTLVIGYTSTNVDIISNNVVYNIPDIERKYISGEKTINRIRISGRYAYLACSFGIVVIDLVKREINDTWKPIEAGGNQEAYDIAFGENKIFAATSQGIYSGQLSNPGLSYFGNWERVNSLPDPAAKYTSVMYSGGILYANQQNAASTGDYIYKITSGSSALFLNIPGVNFVSFVTNENGFTISASTFVNCYDINGNLQRTINSYGWGTPSISQAVTDGSDIWIADKINGLIMGRNMTSFNSLVLPGPVSDIAYHITSYNGRTVISNGGTTASWNNNWRCLQLSIYENNNWTAIHSSTISDPLRTLIDPEDASHLFTTTWGGGLLEFKDNNLVHQYNDSNSPLQTIISGSPYVRTWGLAMDTKRNIWITQTGVPGSIKVLKPDGSWIVFPRTIDAPVIGDILIARNGFKWVVLPGGYGLFVLDDNNTPENFSDDRAVKMLVKSDDNIVIPNVYSLSEDLDGNIWAGTDQGPLVYYNTEDVFREGYHAFRIRVPRNDGTNIVDYLLKTETITSVAVDGGNRKWLGTSGSGVYLVSADGTGQILNFNEQNSPLLSNTIMSIAADNKTGQVWFATTKGIQSYRGNSVEGKPEFSGVYAFPNPVRESYTGNVTITGLMRDTRVKITDVSGNLVFETTSEGGMATWDLSNYKGEHVSTGVYVAFCSDPDRKSAITKILIIK
jgi:Tfp pilus assembly protein FimT